MILITKGLGKNVLILPLLCEVVSAVPPYTCVGFEQYFVQLCIYAYLGWFYII